MDKKEYKITNRDGEYTRRLQESKTGKFCIELPDFDVDKNGNLVPNSKLVKINTYEQFIDYKNRHEMVVNFIMENYPSVIATVYRNSLTSLSDKDHKTAIGKILSGQKIKNTSIYETAFSPDEECLYLFGLNNYNYVKGGFVGREAVLPSRVKRTRKQLMTLLEKDRNGFFVPEIDEKGLVVSVGKGRDHFDVNFIAVHGDEITNEQLFDYLTAPFGDRVQESGIDFQSIAELCNKAYASIGTENMARDMQMLVDYCTANYPLSFSKVKADKKQEEQNNDAPVYLLPSSTRSSTDAPIFEDGRDSLLSTYQDYLRRINGYQWNHHLNPVDDKGTDLVVLPKSEKGVSLPKRKAGDLVPIVDNEIYEEPEEIDGSLIVTVVPEESEVKYKWVTRTGVSVDKSVVKKGVSSISQSSSVIKKVIFEKVEVDEKDEPVR